MIDNLIGRAICWWKKFHVIDVTEQSPVECVRCGVRVYINSGLRYRG